MLFFGGGKALCLSLLALVFLLTSFDVFLSTTRFSLKKKRTKFLICSQYFLVLGIIFMGVELWRESSLGFQFQHLYSHQLFIPLWDYSVISLCIWISLFNHRPKEDRKERHENKVVSVAWRIPWVVVLLSPFLPIWANFLLLLIFGLLTERLFTKWGKDFLYYQRTYRILSFIGFIWLSFVGVLVWIQAPDWLPMATSCIFVLIFFWFKHRLCNALLIEEKMETLNLEH